MAAAIGTRYNSRNSSLNCFSYRNRLNLWSTSQKRYACHLIFGFVLSGASLPTWVGDILLKLFLKLLFVSIFPFMVVMTVRTSLQVPIRQASLTGNPWALQDAYFGFITFFCWVTWREPSLISKMVWPILNMLLGNIAMSLYVLLKLFGLGPDESVSVLFRQRIA